MKDYITAVDAGMPAAQRTALDAFIKDNAGSDSPLEALAHIPARGTKVFSVPGNATKPESYNVAIASAITDLTALYQGLDKISEFTNSADTLNNGELGRVTAEIERLELTLQRSIRLHGTNVEYTHVTHQTFDSDDGDCGKLPPYLQRLSVDTKSCSLVRPMALDVSMVLPTGSTRRCDITVENMLGISAETRHNVLEALDGSTSTCWREVIYAEAPIYASPRVVAWLPSTYRGGAAVKLRFDFESVTTMSDLVIKGMADYPMDVLEVAWSTPATSPKSSGGTVALNGSFETLTGWSTGGSDVPVVDIEAQGSHNHTSCLTLTSPTSGATVVTTTLSHHITLRPDTQYTVSFYACADSVSNQVQVTLYNVTSGAREGTPFTKSVPYWASSRIGWTRYTHTFSTGQTTSAVDLCLDVTTKAGEIKLDDVQISSDYFTIEPGVRTTGPVTTVPLVSTNGQPVSTKTLWLTLGQPNFTIRHMSVDRSLLDVNEMWTLALDTESSVYLPQESELRENFIDNRHDLGSLGDDSGLMKAATKLGGRVKAMLLRLVGLADPSSDTVDIVRYEYVIGALEIDLRLRDYAPNGYWASKPLGLCGEIRQLSLVPTANPYESGKINYYVAAREDDSLDPDSLFKLGDTRTVYFKEGDEESSALPKYASGLEDSVVISVHHKRVVHTELGTNRYNKLQLPSYPYVNLDSVIALDTKLCTGVTLTDGSLPNKYNRYDPNAAYPTYVRTDNDVNGEIDSLIGYTPIKVTLNTGDTTVPPDTMGLPAHTRYKLISNEILSEVGDGMTLRLASTIQKSGASTKDEGINRLLANEGLVAGLQRKLSLDQAGLKSLLHKAASESTIATQDAQQKIFTFVTKFPVAWIDGLGPRIALYWKNRSTETLEFVNPGTYNIKWGQTIAPIGFRMFGLKKTARSRSTSTIELTITEMKDLELDMDTGERKYDLVAYYRTETSSQPTVGDPANPDEFALFDARVGKDNIPLLALQNYPITRNMTNYIAGGTPSLKPANMDPSNQDYYPVFEYYLDSTGSLVFANDLFTYGDTPTLIEVDYNTLDINPRIVVEYAEPLVGMSASRSPALLDYTLLLNVRS